jgi:hypothetical protein
VIGSPSIAYSPKSAIFALKLYGPSGSSPDDSSTYIRWLASTPSEAV